MLAANTDRTVRRKGVQTLATPETTDDSRVHSEAPAEGDTSREFPEVRSHSQAPAEGLDFVTEADNQRRPDRSSRTGPAPAPEPISKPTVPPEEGRNMAGTFELVEPSRGAFEFRLLSSAGKVLVLSGRYNDKASAVAALHLARECAASALVQDHTTDPSQPIMPASLKPRHDQAAPSRWFG